MKEPTLYGFQNVTSPCFSHPLSDVNGNFMFTTDEENADSVSTIPKLCHKQSQYMYFDNIHLGATTNYILALFSAQLIQKIIVNPIEDNSNSDLNASDYFSRVFNDSNNPYLNFLLEKN
jgi:phospholipase/lecithinase/hemolysin